MIRPIHKLAMATLFLTSLVLCTGCATTPDSDSFSMKWPWKKEKEKKPYPNPVKMAVTWTPDILVKPGCTPTRGFGGRVYFYNQKSQAVPVEGDLMIHAFDEALAQSGDPRGVKRYRFTSEQFTQHFSESDLGASYSVWVPYDAAGGVEKKLTMVPSFKTIEGKIVQGEGATIMLPGKKRAGRSRRSQHASCPAGGTLCWRPKNEPRPLGVQPNADHNHPAAFVVSAATLADARASQTKVQPKPKRDSDFRPRAVATRSKEPKRSNKRSGGSTNAATRDSKPMMAGYRR